MTFMNDYDSIQKQHPYITAPLAQTEHLGKHRQYWRDIILGVNDGIISTFLLVVGVSGGGLTCNDILLTAIAGALAGSISMMAGEFVATKAQNEVLTGELALEKHHIHHFPEDEMEELGELLELIGITEDTKESKALKGTLMNFYGNNPDSLLKIMKALEFGVVDEESRSPIWAAVTSGLLFFMGSLPSLLPYSFVQDPTLGLGIAAIATITALGIVGGIKTWATRGVFWSSVTENLVVAGLGGSLAYAVGALFAIILND
jgi:VIT1/CCC1 family predicted Fe2+/Mn2+ transporter